MCYYPPSFCISFAQCKLCDSTCVCDVETFRTAGVGGVNYSDIKTVEKNVGRNMQKLLFKLEAPLLRMELKLNHILFACC